MKEAREGRIKARTAVAPEARQQRDVTELARIKRQYALLEEEHELLKKALGSDARLTSRRFLVSYNCT